MRSIGHTQISSLSLFDDRGILRGGADLSLDGFWYCHAFWDKHATCKTLQAAREWLQNQLPEGSIRENQDLYS